MKEIGKIHIRKLSITQILIWLVLLTPFVMNMFTQFIGLPSVLKYIADACWVLLLVLMFILKRNRNFIEVKILKWAVCGFIGLTFIVYLFNYQSFFYYFWGFRNNFRFFVIIFSIIYYLRKSDINDYLRLLDILFWINAFVMLYQYFILGYKQDYLGGIFGVTTGCNAFVNIFFCITVSAAYLNYVMKKGNVFVFLLKIGIPLVLSAMAELKFFYVEFVIIILAATLITNFSFKKLFIIAAAVAAFIVGLNCMSMVFPNVDMSLSELYRIGVDSNGYTSSGDFNRLLFMERANEDYLNNPFKVLFGLGLGNCDYASGFDFLTTPFYLENYKNHYSWFSSIHMYIENGAIGLIFMIFFFVYMFIINIWISKKHPSPYICKMAALCSVIAVMTFIYNNSLRTEAGYMLYPIMVLPWIGDFVDIVRRKSYLK